MLRSRPPNPRLELPLGGTRLVFGPIWLAVLPLAIWGARAAYVPLLGAALSERDAWLTAVAIVALSLLSLLLHSLAHAATARALQSPLPDEIPIYPTGDAAHVWPVARNTAADLAAALAGPVVSLALALAALAVAGAQPGVFGGAVALFLVLFNAILAAVNLAPCAPFDGGRVLRALIVRLSHAPALASRIATSLGLVLLVCLLVWGMILWAQGLRFSALTTLITFGLLVLTAFALFVPPVWRPDAPDALALRPGPVGVAGWALLSLLAVAMAGVFALVLPLNSGLEAPGAAVPIGPMVQVPPAYAQYHSGALLFTTVIPLAPIVVAGWVYAHVDPAVRLTPAQEIVPPGTSPQQQAAAGVQDLRTSERTAIVVGLRLAGFQSSLTPEGALVEGVVPGSGAQGVLNVGDEIKAVNSNSVSDPSDIARILAAAQPGSVAQVSVVRGGQALTKPVRLSPPSAGSTAPRLGVQVSPAADDLSLPFPVSLNTRQIVGGPSAGLMFTLAVYNALSPQDVTAGHRVAGTGTIDLNGNVGPIGGVEQKVAAAERGQAEYFLCPIQNCAAARTVARRIQIVPVATVQQALDFLRTLSPAADAATAKARARYGAYGVTTV